MKKVWLPILFMVSVFAILCFTQCGVSKIQSSSRPVSHVIWDSLLQQYVTTSGDVNYNGFIQDSTKFNQYLNLLGNNHPNDQNWSRDERLAYWINAYNAYTVKIIVDHYPVDGIKDIKRGIPFVNTVWDIKFINIEDQTYDLNNIEHGIIRKRFEEPRIHFAVNCASVSCPRLRNEAYTAEKLEKQLTDQARYFLRNPVKNRLSNDQLQLSKIFKWFSGDFKDGGFKGVRDFVQQYGPAHSQDADIKYLDYDWRLNDGRAQGATTD